MKNFWRTSKARSSVLVASNVGIGRVGVEPRSAGFGYLLAAVLLSARLVSADCPGGGNAPPPLLQGGYELVWADEFDVGGVADPQNWGYELGFVRNRELQWYRPDNASISEGCLVIEAARERFKNPLYGKARESWSSRREFVTYTSASLHTRNKHEWLYGRFVIRAKIPTAQGMWPAFWTLGQGSWPGCGEIDVMEYYQGEILANAAWSNDSGGPEWDSARVPINTLGDENWAEQFHVWRMDWTPDEINLYVDDCLLNKIETSAANGSGRKGGNPFRQPHYLLINLAVGGINGGDPSETTFPARYLVDYVRVYQRSNDTAADGTGTNR